VFEYIFFNKQVVDLSNLDLSHKIKRQCVRIVLQYVVLLGSESQRGRFGDDGTSTFILAMTIIRYQNDDFCISIMYVDVIQDIKSQKYDLTGIMKYNGLSWKMPHIFELILFRSSAIDQYFRYSFFFKNVLIAYWPLIRTVTHVVQITIVEDEIHICKYDHLIAIFRNGTYF